MYRILTKKSTVNAANSQIYINIPGEDSVFSLVKIYLDLIFDVLHAATGNSCVGGNDKRLVSLGVIALFVCYKWTKSIGKHLEDTSQPHIIPLMDKVPTGAKDTDDLSIGFDRYRSRKQRKLTDSKSVKGHYHVRNMLKDVFGFQSIRRKLLLVLGINQI